MVIGIDCSNCCHGIELAERLNRNRIVSILSGIFFAAGWWIIIDTTFQYPTQVNFNKLYHIIGVVATLALILVNSVSNSRLRSDGFDDSGPGQCGARILLFIGFLIAFGSVIASGWILFGYYVPYNRTHLYPGIALFVQNLTIFISTLLLKFGRKEELSF